jgi:hypothetical protein
MVLPWKKIIGSPTVKELRTPDETGRHGGKMRFPHYDPV